MRANVILDQKLIKTQKEAAFEIKLFQSETGDDPMTCLESGSRRVQHFFVSPLQVQPNMLKLAALRINLDKELFQNYSSAIAER